MFLRFEVVIIEEEVSPSGLMATSSWISKAPVAYPGSLMYGKGSGFGEVWTGPEKYWDEEREKCQRRMKINEFPL